ncbi:MAG: PIN domain-containing protein [Chloroflexota bacterium]
MTTRLIADTGLLVAYLDRRELHHRWGVACARDSAAPWLTCDAVVAEAWYLLRRLPVGQSALLEMVEVGVLDIPFSLQGEVRAVKALCDRYQNVPMSLADACLVRMSELYDDHAVGTLDSDFRIYRRHARRPIRLVTPVP